MRKQKKKKTKKIWKSCINNHELHVEGTKTDLIRSFSILTNQTVRSFHDCLCSLYLAVRIDGTLLYLAAKLPVFAPVRVVSETSEASRRLSTKWCATTSEFHFPWKIHVGSRSDMMFGEHKIRLRFELENTTLAKVWLLFFAIGWISIIWIAGTL